MSAPPPPLPEGMPYPYQPYQPHPGYPPGYRYPPRTNVLAVASLILGFLFAPLGIVFGHLSLSQIKRSGEQGRALAIAGLVVGYVVTIGTVLALAAVALLLAWAVRVAPDYPEAGMPGRRVMPSTPTDEALPAFMPPPGLGSACAYPPTPTPAARPVTPPPAGTAGTRPAVLDAVMVTNDGTVGLRLDNAKAPCTVNSFVSLARQRYFDNTPCHRLATSPDLSVLQCGDPTGTGAGGPGYRFANEYPTNQYRPFDPGLRLPLIYPRGTLAMANSGPDSNGSQFFIVYQDSRLPPQYTVFGRVDEDGLAAVKRLAAAGVSDGSDDGTPGRPITITSLTVK